MGIIVHDKFLESTYDKGWFRILNWELEHILDWAQQYPDLYLVTNEGMVFCQTPEARTLFLLKWL